MHFINEQNDLTFGGLNFLEYGFQAFFKLTTVFGTGNQCAHVEREQFFVFQGFWHIAINNALGQPFHNGGLAHPRFTNQDRVVFATACQHLNGPADFLIPANNGVQFALLGNFGHIPCIFFKCVKISFSIFAGHSASLADCGNGFFQCLRGGPIVFECLTSRAVGRGQSNQKAVLRHKAIPGFLGNLFGGIQCPYQIGGGCGLACATTLHFGKLGQSLFIGGPHTIGVAASCPDQG